MRGLAPIFLRALAAVARDLSGVACLCHIPDCFCALEHSPEGTGAQGDPVRDFIPRRQKAPGSPNSDVYQPIHQSLRMIKYASESGQWPCRIQALVVRPGSFRERTHINDWSLVAHQLNQESLAGAKRRRICPHYALSDHRRRRSNGTAPKQ
jgi:hypothetical protein